MHKFFTYFIIPLIFSFGAYGQVPSDWSSSSTYSSGALVILNDTTYIAQRDIEIPGIPLSNNRYWLSLDDAAPSSAPSTTASTTPPDLSTVPTSSPEGNSEIPTLNFYHGFKHLEEPGADQYLFDQVTIKKYSEWQSPPLTYFGPSLNDELSTMTYRYSFDGAVQSAKARISLSVWNFNVSGAYGSGSGQASAWASKDGSNWINLVDIPTPSTFSSGKTFEGQLPESVLGFTDLYLQIRMQVSGAPNTSYTTAQFGRSDANYPTDIFYLDVEYARRLPFNSGLVAWYPLDGNASDMTGNGNDGTVYGASLGVDRNGNANHSYEFDGVDDFIEVGFNPNLNPSSFTLSAWVKPTEIISSRPQYQNVASVVTSRSDSPTQGYMLYQYSDNRWRSQSGGNSWWYPTYGLDVELNKWINLSMTHSMEEGATRLYENGVLVGVSNESFVANTSKPLRIGGGSTESLTPKYFFPGSIDDIRIYNRALSSTEVNELYELEKPFDPNEGLVAYFPFDGNASDMSGNGNDGTVYGAALSTDRNGDANKAYAFDGENDYIKVGGPSSLTNGENQTISVWVTGTDIGNPIYWDDDTQNGGDLKISIHEGSVIRFKRTGSVVLYTTDTVDMTKWNHIVVSFKDDTTYKIYINGSLSLKEDLVDNLDLDNRTHISIGSGHNGYQGYFEGSIDEVRHYARTLSDREVAALYAIEKPKRVDITTGLVAYYPFDGNASDMSGNGNDGTVYGATLGTDRHGQTQMAYEFDGTNDWIGLSQQIPDLENFTLSAWFNGKGSIFQDETESSGNDFGIFFHGSDGTFRIRNSKGGSSFNESYDPADYINENWNQVVFSLSADKVIVAFNGNKIEYEGTYTGNVGYHSSEPRIGTYNYFGNSNFFDGLIDDIRLYERALSSDEISALHELEKPRFNIADCMQHLPVGSLIAIPVGTSAPSGLSLVQDGESGGFDLYQVDGPVPINDSFAVGVSEVIKNPSKFGLFTQEDINSSRDTAKKEGEDIGKSLGEYSVINNPAGYGLVSNEDHLSILAETNASARSVGAEEGRNEILADPYSYNLVTRLEYDQIAESLRVTDTNATPYTEGWFFIPDRGWLWTTTETYPWFYDSDTIDWIYFKQGGALPRYYNYNAEKWLEWADFVKRP